MHVLVNAAISADGKLSTRRREQVAISGAEDFSRVERVRADSDAVMVGVGTVLADDPHLTVDEPEHVAAREERGEPPQPARVVADSRARTPTEARLLDDAAQTFVLVSAAASEERRQALEDAGADVIEASEEVDQGADGEPRVDLASALAELEARGVDQCMVEGGGELIFSLFEDGLVDELTTFVGPTVIGGRDAPTLADGDGFVDEFVDLELADTERLDGGVLLSWAIEASP